MRRTSAPNSREIVTLSAPEWRKALVSALWAMENSRLRAMVEKWRFHSVQLQFRRNRSDDREGVDVRRQDFAQTTSR